MDSSERDQGETGIDHEALRDAARRARRLYAAEAQTDAVVEVTEDLRGHLRATINTCAEVAAQLPRHSLSRMRLDGALATAGQLLKDGPGKGPLSAVVHMQLLADSAVSLAAKAKKAQW